MNHLRVCIFVFVFAGFAARAEETSTSANAGVSGNAAPSAVESNALPASITIDGTIYEDVRWQRVTQGTVTIFHKTGIATIPLEKLPPELQKRFGYDPQKALDYHKRDMAAQAAMAEQERARSLAYSHAVKEKATHQAVFDAIVNGAINVQGNVGKVLPNGAEIHAFTETTHLKRVGDRPDAGGVWKTVEVKERHDVSEKVPIFVLGPGSSFANRNGWSSKVYPAGTYKGTGWPTPMKCFALSPEDALAYTLGNK